MPYTILLVDDETAVREGIRSRTPWEKYNFEVIGEAGNGIEALEMVTELRPDVVITDIRMPYLDGMELIKELKAAYPAITLIILSGYDEFTYAQQAIRFDVSEYVLKPVSVEDICNLLERLSKRLDEDIQRLQDQDRLKQAYQQALPIIREKFLVSLLATVRQGLEGNLVARAREYGYDLDMDEFMVCVFETDHDEDDPLQALAMFQVAEDVFSKEEGAIVFGFENQVVIIFTANSHGQGMYDAVFRKQTFRKAEQLLAYLQKYSFKVVLGLGGLVHTPQAIAQTYQQALSALNYSASYPEQSLLFINDLEQLKGEETLGGLEQLKSNVLVAVKLGSELQVSEAVSQLFGEHLASMSQQELQTLLLELASSLNEVAQAYGHSLFMVGEEGRNLFLELGSLTTLGKAKRWFTKFCLSLHCLISGQREKSHVQFIQQAKEFIAKHFTEAGFGLDQICEMIGVSPSYFSSTFKREVGLSFVQYLTGIRMDRAKELLVKTEGKTYEISQAVGYSEPNYFSFSFKRYVGLSPSQYRQANR